MGKFWYKKSLVTSLILLTLGLLLTYMYNDINFRVQNQPTSSPVAKLPAQIHIVTNYALMTEKPWSENQTTTNTSQLRERQLELDEVLQRNIDNPFVSRVHLLVNQESAHNRLLDLPLGKNREKIIVQRISAMPRYRDFLSYISKKLLKHLVIFMNMDIYLGEGFENLNKTYLEDKNVCYTPTRHGRKELRCDMSGNRGYCGQGYVGSHDTYIFVLMNPLPNSVLSELDYPMNFHGAENVFMWVVERRLGMKILNPCKYLKTYHNHCVDIHGNFRPRINKAWKKSLSKREGGLYDV